MNAIKMNYRVAIGLVLCAALCPLGAQSPTATLVGTVMDPTGLAVGVGRGEGRNSGTNEVRKIETDQRGQVTAPNLAPGSSAVTISTAGFPLLHQTGTH